MQTIVSLKEGDWVEEVYLVTSKQISTAKNGVTYLSLKLADKTGEIDGRLWDNADEVAGKFEREDFVRIRGMASNYQGTMQIKMKTLEKVDDSKVDIANFLECSPRNPDEMVNELKGHCRVFVQRAPSAADELVFERRGLPGAVQTHTGGQNAASQLHRRPARTRGRADRARRDVAKHFPSIDRDLVTAGAFLHDIGKVRELAVRKSIEYTTEGRLIGHISLGYEMIVERVKAIPGFPAELTLLLKHIMLSHHGEYEFGSPKRPKIQEAIVINYLDDLAAKINNFQATLKKEQVAEGGWTGFSKMHDRYLYRQMAYSGAENDRNNDSEETEEGKPHGAKGKKTSAAADRNASGKLPLDL